jgi:hypothetical protein
MSSPQYRRIRRVPFLLFVGLVLLMLLAVDATLVATWPASTSFTVFVNVVLAAVLVGAWCLP